MYDCEVLVEPQPLLAKIKMLPGIDKRKMSKSYGNDIALSASPKEVKSQVHQMVTDPARIRKDDPGHPDICTVYSYQGFYNEAEQAEIGEACRAGQIGCGECKKRLTAKMNEFLAPILARRSVLIKDQQLVDDVLAAGAAAAQLEAEATMQLVREALKI